MSKWKTQKQHLQFPYECPCCGSGDISGDGVDVVSGSASQEVSCNACNAVWVDEYHLVKYKPLKDSDGKDYAEEDR